MRGEFLAAKFAEIGFFHDPIGAVRAFSQPPGPLLLIVIIFGVILFGFE